MLVTDKVNQLATDSNLVHSWVHGAASGATSMVSTLGGNVRTPARLIAEKSVDIDNAIDAAIESNMSKIVTVVNNITDVIAIGDNLTTIKASPSNAAVASAAANYLATYVDAFALSSITFPLDLGLIVDPVAPFNTFDLGAL